MTEMDGLWGCSSAGRAAALQAVGSGFESCHLHQINVDVTEMEFNIKVALFLIRGFFDVD